MKLPPLDYIRPGSLAEALEIWTGDQVMFLAGGQGLLSEMGQGLRRPTRLLDISAIPELTAIDVPSVGSHVRVGAAVRLAEIAAHPAAAQHVGVGPVRTLATVGGNFCHGNPTAELPLAALVASASLTGVRRDGSEVRLTGPELAAMRRPADRSELLITALEWPVLGEDHSAGFAEVGEQRSWIPAVALGWLVGRTPGPAHTAPGARVGIALRDGGSFVITRPEGTPACSMASIESAAEVAGVQLRVQVDWLADLVNHFLDAAVTSEGA